MHESRQGMLAIRVARRWFNLLIDRDIPVSLLTRVTHKCALATHRRVGVADQ